MNGHRAIPQLIPYWLATHPHCSRAFDNITELHDPNYLSTEPETCTEQSSSDDSVLCLFSFTPTSTKGSTSFLSRIIKFVQSTDSFLHSHPSSKASSGHVLQPLLDILSSERSNDEISSEMVGLLGYDELELIMQILADRINVRQEVCAVYSNPVSLSLQNCSSISSDPPTILTTLSFMIYPNVRQVICRVSQY